jgi:hypothetical protein
LANFGAGCGRWLHLIIGGQGEFGKTPLWSDFVTTQTGLGRKDLRLTRADLATLSTRPSLSFAITHLALGEIRKTAGSVTLTYQWWSLRTRKPSGAPVAVKGTEAVVVAQLPKLAARLCSALGIRDPHVPRGVAESVEDLRALGSCPRVPGQGGQRAALPHFAALDGRFAPPDGRFAPAGGANKQPLPVLAAFLNMISEGSLRHVPHVTATGDALTQALPDNALVYAEYLRWVARSCRATGSALPADAIKLQLARYPYSFRCSRRRATFSI